MSCDKLVFDLSQEVEGSPNVFIRKDWINILDNQNQNYQNNQSIIDTSQLANSNKYMAYREAYLSVPMLLSYRTQPQAIAPGLPVGPQDYSIGLKNWFGTIIHSMTLDYNGTTIVQQTPFCNLWNSFKLLTTLSWADVKTQGPSIGFYPDTPDSFQLNYPTAPPAAATSVSGLGIVNNFDGDINISNSQPLITNQYTQPLVGIVGSVASGGNVGLTMRTKWIAYNQAAVVGAGVIPGGVLPVNYGNALLNNASSALVWKSFISNKASSVLAGERGILQISVMASIYLKHIHSFFNMCPLLKGVFMKLTLNLNNSRATINGTAVVSPIITCTDSTSYIGGTQPLLVPSTNTGGLYNAVPAAGDAFYDLVVGATCYNNNITGVTGPASLGGLNSRSVYLYVPAYTFNPSFEKAYLANNIKQIKYTDIYQYQFDIARQETFNQLITNGIANIKSVLIVPVSRLPIAVGQQPVVEYLSPFSPCGGGTTCPMATLTNFNIQISGQNAIYNMQKYSFEEWNNQLYGQNAVNGGLTDGLTSGLVDFFGFQTSYSYYYVNVERMLPVEQSVPKSVQIIGQNLTEVSLRLMVFIEYGVQVSIDVLTGARV
jgi:hypothetical protein